MNFIDIENAEVEDIVDTKLIANVASKMFRGEEDFEDSFDNKTAIIPQIEKYCNDNSIEIPKGWKVDLARQVKSKMIKEKYLSDISESQIERWTKIFNSWISAY